MEPRSFLNQWVRALGTTTDIFGKEDIDHLVNVNKAKAKTLEAIKALQRLTPIQHDRELVDTVRYHVLLVTLTMLIWICLQCPCSSGMGGSVRDGCVTK